MPGRYPMTVEQIEKDNRTKRKTKAEIQARKENTPKIESATLRAPVWLDDVAKKEWRRIVRLARDSGIYTDLDVNALGMYCRAFSRAIEAYKEYRILEGRVRQENPDANMLIAKGGKVNPLILV